jgi:hypothetical protein
MGRTPEYARAEPNLRSRLVPIVWRPRHVINIAQISPWPFAKEALVAGMTGCMFTSDECRFMAEQKLAQAEHNLQHRRRLVTAAQGWILLARQLIQVEADTRKAEKLSSGPAI